jgi:hypothetical protein
MTIRKVRFVTPERAYFDNNTLSLKYGGNIHESPAASHHALDDDPIAWWGAYVPLELWTPPKLRKSKFKGVVGLEDYPNFKSKHGKLWTGILTTGQQQNTISTMNV